MFNVRNPEVVRYTDYESFPHYKTVVEVEAIEAKDRDLLTAGRVQDALNLMDKLERIINAAQNETMLLERLGVNAFDLKKMKSFDPNNKE
jgi:hypothetical protein